MALNKANANATAATFETEEKDETMTQDTAPATEQAAPATTVLTAPAANALVTPRTSALATANSVVKMNVISGLKDTFRVEFDSLPGIGASQGTFNLKADDTDIGAEISIQLLSYQESWVASPNDTKADVELVKYSDDGVTSRDGINLLAHLEDLKAQGYSKAKIAHRVILVGELLATAKDCDKVGELMMIDLPDSGRRAFNTYVLQASYAVAKGRKTTEEAAILKLKAVPEKTKSGERYMKVVFA